MTASGPGPSARCPGAGLAPRARGAAIGAARHVSPAVYARLLWLYRRWRGALAVRVVEACVRRGDVVVDVGANWGLYAHRLAGLVGPAGHVHAVEPDPAMAGYLDRLRARWANVTVHRLAVSDHSGMASLAVPVVNGVRVSALGSLARAPGRAALRHEVVPVLTQRLDALLPADTRVAFVKCDAEGHEAAVLRGAAATLRRHRPALLCAIEARHRDRAVWETFDALRAFGYDGFALYPDGLRPLAAFDVGRDQLAYLGDGFPSGSMPPGYVQHFLFVQASAGLAGLMAPGSV
jgi:FkbM family methyltransferase